MNENLNDIKFKCTGCNCCAEVCPKNAIELKQNEEGFLEFTIDKNKCINCGLCVKRCPQINTIVNEEDFDSKYYAMHSKTEEDILRSSSGAAFTVFASEIAKESSYAIFGCYFDENIVAKHGFINNIEELQKFRGSKYVQSDTRNIYSKVKNELENEKTVLFTGTPCQIAGLKMFLNREYPKLYTIDIICHGVPSPLLFEKYKEYLEKKKKSKLKKYEFRNKSKKEWECYYYYYYFENNKKKRGIYTLDSYYYNFMKGNSYRESCYECKYAKKERVSDITIGDFWGIQKEHPNNYLKIGNSAISVNTKKGQDLFERVKNEIVYEESSYEKISKYNGNLIKPTERKPIRDTIYKNIKEKNYEEIEKENMNFKIRFIDLIKAYFPKKLKNLIKKFILTLQEKD